MDNIHGQIYVFKTGHTKKLDNLSHLLDGDWIFYITETELHYNTNGLLPEPVMIKIAWHSHYTPGIVAFYKTKDYRHYEENLKSIGYCNLGYLKDTHSFEISDPPEEPGKYVPSWTFGLHINYFEYNA